MYGNIDILPAESIKKKGLEVQKGAQLKLCCDSLDVSEQPQESLLIKLIFGSSVNPLNFPAADDISHNPSKQF